MIKKAIKIITIISILFFVLILSSLFLSNYRLSKYNNSVINDEIIPYDEVDRLFEKTTDETIYVFLYDKDDDDCIYLDEVLLKDISNNYNGIKFEDIYKVEYEQSYRSYIHQLIKNTYQIETFPAIVAIQKDDNGKFIKIDSFEYQTSQEKNEENLEAFLERNHFFEISQKD